MSELKVSKDKPIERTQLMKAYTQNATTYLKTLYPQYSEEKIAQFVKEVVTDKFKQGVTNRENLKFAGVSLDQQFTPAERPWPTITVLRHCDGTDSTHAHSCGNLDCENEVDLLSFISQHNNKVITPFGSFYETADNLESFLKGMIDGKGKARKAEKKAMFLAKKNGDHTAEVFHNNAQANIKINMNSIIGAMGANFNFLSDIANFNSVTSTGRHFVMTAYAHAERFLQSNFYFKTSDQVLNFLVTCQRYGPSDDTIEDVLRKFPLYRPTAEVVYDWLCKNLHRYNLPTDHPDIRAYTEHMTPARLTWVFYMSNMRQLVMRNEAFFRPWMDQFFNLSGVDLSQPADPEELNSLDGDLSVVLATVCHQLIPTNKTGNSINLTDTITQAPDIAKSLVLYGRHLQSCLDAIQPLFDLFMNHQVGIGYLAEHKFMFRDAVILSDTDSIIFTTREWVEWYLGDTKMTPAAFSMNALVVYWLSKATANLIYHLSVNFGAVGSDAKRMNMKNEFMMPVEILTTLKKHYASILKIQEGVFYGTPRLDIKGVNLRGSNFSKDTLNYTTWFIQSLIDEVYNTGKVKLSRYIVGVLEFERMIYDSLSAGETRFLTVSPVKNLDEYTDEERTIYFNYLFWEAVFAEKYGNIAIPTKCFILPLTDITERAYQDYLDVHHPRIHRAIAQFRKKYQDKKITRIPINPLTNQIPQELKYVINYRSIIYANTRPLYLIMSSFGLNSGSTTKSQVLFSEIYGQVTLTDDARTNLERICTTGSL